MFDCIDLAFVLLNQQESSTNKIINVLKEEVIKQKERKWPKNVWKYYQGMKHAEKEVPESKDIEWLSLKKKVSKLRRRDKKAVSCVQVTVTLHIFSWFAWKHKSEQINLCLKMASYE